MKHVHVASLPRLRRRLGLARGAGARGAEPRRRPGAPVERRPATLPCRTASSGKPTTTIRPSARRGDPRRDLQLLHRCLPADVPPDGAELERRLRRLEPAFTMDFPLVAASGHRPVHPLDGDALVRAGRSADHLLPARSRRPLQRRHAITADDYVFTWQMMLSEHIVDPFYNNYAKLYFESVDRIDDHTLRIVGTRPSWRPLADYAGLWPDAVPCGRPRRDWVSAPTTSRRLRSGRTSSPRSCAASRSPSNACRLVGRRQALLPGAVQLRPHPPARHSRRAAARLTCAAARST
jgi:hypothetical protein